MGKKKILQIPSFPKVQNTFYFNIGGYRSSCTSCEIRKTFLYIYDVALYIVKPTVA